MYLSEQRFRERAPDVVIFAPNNHIIKPLKVRAGDFRRPREKPGVLAAIGPALRLVNQRLGRNNGLTPAFRTGYNGALYRLRGHPDVVSVEGRPAIVLPLAEQHCFETPEQRQLAGVIDSVTEFARQLRERGTTLVFAPIPDTAEVYPELFPPEQIARCARPSLFDRLVPAAREAGVEAVDLRAVFRANKVPYLYRHDDSHWTPRGVRVAAAALAAAIAPHLAGPPAAGP
jgi:hypothetical protein